MNVPRVRAPFGRGRLPNIPPLTLVCQEFVPLCAVWFRTTSRNWLKSGRASCGPGGAVGESQDLMPKADPKDRHALRGNLPHRLLSLFDRGRVAGTVRQKDAVWS